MNTISNQQSFWLFRYCTQDDYSTYDIFLVRIIAQTTFYHCTYSSYHCTFCVSLPYKNCPGSCYVVLREYLLITCFLLCRFTWRDDRFMTVTIVFLHRRCRDTRLGSYGCMRPTTLNSRRPEQCHVKLHIGQDCIIYCVHGTPYLVMVLFESVGTRSNSQAWRCDVWRPVAAI